MPNNLPHFIKGQRISITGSKVNDGTYTIIDVDATGTSVTVAENLNQEASGANVSLASVGGSDLSVFYQKHLDPAFDFKATMQLTGKVFHDDVYQLHEIEGRYRVLEHPENSSWQVAVEWIFNSTSLQQMLIIIQIG